MNFSFSLRALALAGLVALPAQAQTAPPPDPAAPEDPAAATAAVNAEARAEYATLVEAAQAAQQQATAASFQEAAMTYLEAVSLAEASGDDELVASAKSAVEAAIKSHVDAGSAFSEAEDYAAAGEQFEKAAELAGRLDNVELRAKTYYNAGQIYLQAKEYERAIAALDNAIEASPNDLNAAFYRALAMRSSGDAEASAAFEAVMAKAEEMEDAEMVGKVQETVGKGFLIEANEALKAQNYGTAVAALDEAAKFLGEDHATMNKLYSSAYYKMGADQVKAEQFDAAKRSLGQAQTYARRVGQDKIVAAAQQQLDYIEQVMAAQ